MITFLDSNDTKKLLLCVRALVCMGLLCLNANMHKVLRFLGAYR